ncbi:MAG: hypothetical protein MN733_13145, partial [Nitrososphaera sp.]|nr:hypothetical protein [Nitrososphaera sp.]
VVLVDEAQIINKIRQFQANTKSLWCASVDASLPSFSINKVKSGYLEAKRRGVKIKYLTEITKENAEYCKEIMTFAELRHLKNLRGNFALSETEYIAGLKEGDSIASLLYSDVKELIEQQRLIFETLWDLAVPATIRIKEIL